MMGATRKVSRATIIGALPQLSAVGFEFECYYRNDMWWGKKAHMRPLDQVEHHGQLIIANGRSRQLDEGPLAAVGPAAHLDQARLVAGVEPHDLRMTRPVPTSQRVEDPSDILREFRFPHTVLGLIQLHAIIDELRAVAGSLVVPPV